MDRPKRVPKESRKLKETRETIQLLMRNVVNKPPTKAFIRSAKRVAKVREETKYREELTNARTNASAAIVKHGSMDGAATTSVPLNIPSTVETKRNLVRKRKKELMNPPVKMMDPKEILKNPSKMLVSPYHTGFPLENFEVKACADPKCNFPVRSYIIHKNTRVKTEPGFASFETAEMCCNPGCMQIPASRKTRTMPIDLYRQRLSICDDTLLRGPEQGTTLEYELPTEEDVLNLNIAPHPNPDPEVVMKLVEEYEAAGRPKFQMKKIGPMNSDDYLHNMCFDFEENKRKKLGLIKVEKEDVFESQDEFD